ncbi:MAG: nucleotidyltransferase family protein [Gemmatimonadetes bacterium]|nr:nucleotidyltransferase family protein [Gemmatimonadota bacterium]
MTALAPPHLLDGLSALLRGDRVAWASLDVTSGQFLATCREEDALGLVHDALGRQSEPPGWPRALREEIAREARAAVATELLRRREIITVLDALAAPGIQAILLKGTPLAYSVYPQPHFRPRSDTDLLIRQDHVPLARAAMTELGYAATTYCDGELLFRQFEYARRDQFGLAHAFDFHWQISMHAAFADLLTYDELAAEAVPVPSLGPHARAPGMAHALLLACVHAAMHHQNLERLIWVYDVHLLCARLDQAERCRFADLARDKRVAAICAYQLRLAQSRFGTAAGATLARLGAAGPEASAVYLRRDRRWHDELVSNLRGLGRWSDRLRLLREVAFPNPDYMLEAYRIPHVRLGVALLPALYLHRGVRGVWKILTRRK